jgi:hypothetical protein
LRERERERERKKEREREQEKGASASLVPPTRVYDHGYLVTSLIIIIMIINISERGNPPAAGVSKFGPEPAATGARKRAPKDERMRST